ncbi:hypothetical protein D3C86_1606400 [compost metagenome]
MPVGAVAAFSIKLLPTCQGPLEPACCGVPAVRVTVVLPRILLKDLIVASLPQLPLLAITGKLLPAPKKREPLTVVLTGIVPGFTTTTALLLVSAQAPWVSATRYVPASLSVAAERLKALLNELLATGLPLCNHW